MRKYPPTPGEPGTTVTGKVIPPNPGKQLDFSPQLKGAEVDSDDPDLLLATMGGRPVAEAQGVNVEQAVSLKKVDFSTGNIRFDGSVEIEGDLGHGMLIEATGDVLINGMLEVATVRAGRDVMVGKGVLGHGEAVDDEGNVTDQAAQVYCGGGFHSRFIQSAYIRAGKNIETMEHVVHSDLTSGDCVCVGEEQGKKGQLMGGVVRARNSIQANSIGSPGSVYTELEVGYDPDLYHRHVELSHHASDLIEEKGKLKTLITRLSLKGAGQEVILKKARNTLEAIREEISGLKKELAQVEAKLEMVEGATVSVSTGIYSNTLLHVAGEVLLLRHDKGVGTFSIHKGELIFR